MEPELVISPQNNQTQSNLVYFHGVYRTFYLLVHLRAVIDPRCLLTWFLARILEHAMRLNFTEIPARDISAPRWIYVRVDSRFAHSQWETVLHCNDVSQWLGANLESALWYVFRDCEIWSAYFWSAYVFAALYVIPYCNGPCCKRNRLYLIT